MKKSIVFGIGLFVFVAVVATGLYVLKDPESQAIESGRIVEPARPLAEFTLTDTDGQTVHRKDFLGKWTVLAFGFTNCPDICPTTLAFFKNEIALLDSDQKNYQFAFVSVDPERDTPTRLREYVDSFSPEIKAYTGTDSELKKLTNMVGSYFTKQQDGDSYNVMHSPYFFLINPEGEWQAFYKMPLGRGKVATDLTRLAGQSRSLF